MTSQEYSIVYSKDFYHDLREIHQYIAIKLNALQSANKIVLRICSVADSLAFMPRRFAVVQDAKRPEDCKRRAPCGNYGIYYLVIEKKLKVQVLRVIRKGRDVAKLLNVQDQQS